MPVIVPFNIFNIEEPEIPSPPELFRSIVSPSTLVALTKKLPAWPASAVRFVAKILALVAPWKINPFPPPISSLVHVPVSSDVSSMVPFLRCFPIPPIDDTLFRITLFGLDNCKPVPPATLTQFWSTSGP